MKKILLSICLAVVAVISVQAQTEAQLCFRTDIDMMEPMGYPSRSVDDFFLTMRGDTLDLYLPYMGEVYSPSFDDDGLNFKTVAEKLVRSKDKKGNDMLCFDARHNGIMYSFRITLYKKGRSYVYLMPSNAQSISYSGSWKLLE